MSKVIAIAKPQTRKINSGGNSKLSPVESMIVIFLKFPIVIS